MCDTVSPMMWLGVAMFQYSQRLLRPLPCASPLVSTMGCVAHPTAARFSLPSGSVSDTGSVSSGSIA